MPKGTKRKSASSANGIPKGMDFGIQVGGDLDGISSQFKSGANSDVLRIGENEEYTLAILDVPENWARVKEHGITADKGGWTYIPCITNCPVCKRVPDNNARMYAFIPCYIYQNKKVQYYRAPGTVVTELITKYKRYKSTGFLNFMWILTRYDGDGPVRYDMDRQMEKVPSKIKRMLPDAPDIQNVLTARYTRGLEYMGWTHKESDYEQADEEEDEVVESYEEDSDDVSEEDIEEMNKKQLIQLIEDYEWDIESPEEIKLRQLRVLVKRYMEQE